MGEKNKPSAGPHRKSDTILETQPWYLKESRKIATFIVRHKVKDYEIWKKTFVAHGKTRAQAGFTKSRVYRYVDDPNHLILVCDVKDIQKAKAFATSPDLAQTMKAAGVIDEPKAFFLDDGESFPS